MKYHLLDLFSGLGGFHKGLSDAGFEFNRTCFSEVDKHAIAIYKHNFKDAEYHGSVTTIRGNELRQSESEKWIVTFGFPCQDISLAGKRKGFSGDRSSLFFEAVRIINELKPCIFIAENVKGIFSSQDGRDFATVLRTFADLRIYDTEWQLLNTRWFLPQNRERVYFIGHLRGGSGRKVFPIGESNGIFNKKNNREQKEQSRIWSEDNTSTISSSYGVLQNSGETYLKVGTLRTHKDGQGFREVAEPICPTIPSRAREDGSGMPVIIQKSQDYREKGELRQFKDCPTLRANMGDNAPMLIQKSEQRVNGKITEREICPTLTCGGIGKNGDTQPLVVKPVLTPNRPTKRQNRRRFKDDGEPSFTLTSQDQHGVALQNRIRRLTPVECERLQGFDDNWTALGNYDGVTKEVSDTQRYKTIGNAVSVPVVKIIATTLTPR